MEVNGLYAGVALARDKNSFRFVGPALNHRTGLRGHEAIQELPDRYLERDQPKESIGKEIARKGQRRFALAIPLLS